MIIRTLTDELLSRARSIHEKTVDTFKIGDPQRDVTHVGVCFMATAEVVREAAERGVEFLITHEPVYYDHLDRYREDQPLVRRKKELLEASGLTIWRYHDHIHDMPVDGIESGMMETLGWKGQMTDRCFWKLERPMTARQMAYDIKTKLGCGGVRICGQTDMPFTMLRIAEGDPGADTGFMDRLFAMNYEGIVFFGEACEWGALEQFRDAKAFGMNVAAVVCGHAASEEAAMERLAEDIAEKHPELTVDFIPTGEVYEHI